MKRLGLGCWLAAVVTAIQTQITAAQAHTEESKIRFAVRMLACSWGNTDADTDIAAQAYSKERKIEEAYSGCCLAALVTLMQTQTQH